MRKLANKSGNVRRGLQRDSVLFPLSLCAVRQEVCRAVEFCYFEKCFCIFGGWQKCQNGVFGFTEWRGFLYLRHIAGKCEWKQWLFIEISPPKGGCYKPGPIKSALSVYFNTVMRVFAFGTLCLMGTLMFTWAPALNILYFKVLGKEIVQCVSQSNWNTRDGISISCTTDLLPKIIFVFKYATTYYLIHIFLRGGAGKEPLLLPFPMVLGLGFSVISAEVTVCSAGWRT